MAETRTTQLNKYSAQITQRRTRGISQAMLFGTGYETRLQQVQGVVLSEFLSVCDHDPSCRRSTKSFAKSVRTRFCNQ